MARNKAIALTADQIANADRVRPVLAGLASASANATVEYVKRDGTLATLKGEVMTFVGQNDTEAITLMTDKGYRSANLWAIKAIV